MGRLFIAAFLAVYVLCGLMPSSLAQRFVFDDQTLLNGINVLIKALPEFQSTVISRIHPYLKRWRRDFQTKTNSLCQPVSQKLPRQFLSRFTIQAPL